MVGIIVLAGVVLGVVFGPKLGSQNLGQLAARQDQQAILAAESREFDNDRDGFSDDNEKYIGTDPGKACPADVTKDNESPDQWPPDFNDDMTVDNLDLNAITSHFGKRVTGSALKRYDINKDKYIDISDVARVSGYFGKKCQEDNLVAATGLDVDADGFTNVVESAIGTDPLKSCPADRVSSNEDIDAWPPDFNDDGFVDTGDQTQIPNNFGKAADTPTLKRYDLSNDNYIDIADLALISPLFGKNCPSPL